MRIRSACLLACVCVLSLNGYAEERTLLILHTNDLHDHVRPDYDGSGGLAYVSGFVQSVRSERGDVLLFDAGDVMEKGDIVAFKTESRMMYEAMGRIGYDAAAPGNHDDAYGDDHLELCTELAPNTAFLAINLLRPNGNLRFPASKVFTRNQLEVGTIGVFKPRDNQSLDLEETAAAVAREAARLDETVDLVVVVAHLGPGDCSEIGRAAPAVDIFVSGHTHQALFKPIVLEETGALIVQAGSYADYVGQLELVIDDESEAIVWYRETLVPMDHDTIPVDHKMQNWLTEREAAIAPDASRHVVENPKQLGYRELAYLGAEGIRRAADVDIAFCHMSQIIRAPLPTGPVDVNAVFRTGGQRAHDLVNVSLTGAEIVAYVEGLGNTDWGETHWSGFRGRYSKSGGRTAFESNLDHNRTYSVAISQKEWDTRFLRYFDRHGAETAVDSDRIRRLKPQPIETTFTSAVVKLLDEEGTAPAELANRIERQALTE